MALPGAPAMSRLPMADAYINAVRPRMSLRLMSVFVCLGRLVKRSFRPAPTLPLAVFSLNRQDSKPPLLAHWVFCDLAESLFSVPGRGHRREGRAICAWQPESKESELSCAEPGFGFWCLARGPQPQKGYSKGSRLRLAVPPFLASLVRTLTFHALPASAMALKASRSPDLSGEGVILQMIGIDSSVAVLANSSSFVTWRDSNGPVSWLLNASVVRVCSFRVTQFSRAG